MTIVGLVPGVCDGLIVGMFDGDNKSPATGAKLGIAEGALHFGNFTSTTKYFEHLSKIFRDGITFVRLLYLPESKVRHSIFLHKMLCYQLMKNHS